MMGKDLRSMMSAWSLNLSLKIYVNYRVRDDTFSVEKPGGHPLGQVIKVASPVVTHINIKYPSHDTLRRAYLIFAMLAQNVRPQYNHEKASDKPKLRNNLQNN